MCTSADRRQQTKAIQGISRKWTLLSGQCVLAGRRQKQFVGIVANLAIPPASRKTNIKGGNRGSLSDPGLSHTGNHLSELDLPLTMCAGYSTVARGVMGRDGGDLAIFVTSVPGVDRRVTQFHDAPGPSSECLQAAVPPAPDMDPEFELMDEVDSVDNFEFVQHFISSVNHLYQPRPGPLPGSWDLELCSSHHISVTHSHLPNGLYKYTEQLRGLQSFRLRVQRVSLPAACQNITTPLRWESWQQALSDHPDGEFTRLLVTGIKEGFRIGFDDRLTKLKARQGNMKSAVDNPDPVVEYLGKELDLGRISEVPPEVASRIHTSKFGVIPKSNQPGKWRLILDLSSPKGNSVNDGVPKELCSMHYATIDEAVEAVVDLGPGALLAKIDVKEAYRNIPVHPEDRTLLGMSWAGRTFVDCQLPFGLRSAPLLFSAVADALEWIVRRRGISFCLHYLDDFLTVGPAQSEVCSSNLQLLSQSCRELGVPLKVEKVEGPATSMVFLGIEMDSVKGTLAVPQDKLARYKGELQAWRVKKAARKRELLSLIGKLSHTCKVIRPGRIFLRRMIDLACSVERMDYWVRLNQEFRSDLQWWVSFLELWNGRALLRRHNSSNHIQVVSDASGKWGCGAQWSNRWIQCAWANQWQEVNIAAKELLPIVLACATWGPLWRHQAILVQCDNMAVVSVWAARSSRHTLMMHLLRCAHFICAHFDIDLEIVHIRGKDNVIADAISRNLLQVLHKEAPDLDLLPTPIHPALWDLLVTSQPDWLCPRWNQLWNEFLRAV